MNLHYDSCSGLAEKTWTNKSAAMKKKWKCELNCREGKARTPLNESNDLPQDTEAGETKETEKILQMILAKMVMFEDWEEKQSKLMEKISENNELIKNLNKKIEEQDKKMEMKDKIIKEMAGKINDLEQYGRNKQWELHNIPEKEKEDLEDLVVKIGAKLKIQINKNNIEAVHRINSKNINKPRPIIIEMQSRRMRNDIIEARKKIITQNEMLGNGSGERIFINESLTPLNKSLLWKAKETGKEKGYKCIWYKNNRK